VSFFSRILVPDKPFQHAKHYTTRDIVGYAQRPTPPSLHPAADHFRSHRNVSRIYPKFFLCPIPQLIPQLNTRRFLRTLHGHPDWFIHATRPELISHWTRCRPARVPSTLMERNRLSVIDQLEKPPVPKWLVLDQAGINDAGMQGHTRYSWVTYRQILCVKHHCELTLAVPVPLGSYDADGAVCLVGFEILEDDAFCWGESEGRRREEDDAGVVVCR